MTRTGSQSKAASQPAVGDGPEARRIALAFLAIAGGIYALTTLSYFQSPLLDVHAFRQCQTAISATYLATDLNPLRMLTYETPLMGAPWRIPFEFPIYQWLVAVVHRVIGLPIDQSGRLVAITFHLACFWPLWRIVRDLGGSFVTWAILAGLFLLAPTYHHWSRSVLIESTAVFLSLEFLACYLQWIQTRRPVPLLLACVWAALAVLVKVTTFPAFAVVGLGLMARDAWGRFKRGEPRRSILIQLLVAGLPFCVALAALVPWLAVCDAVKLENPLGATTTSKALAAWNYGTLAQRLSWDLWGNAILLRAIPEAVGWPGLALILIGLWRLRGGTRTTLLVLIALYFIPWLVFTNLHFVHNYYQCSNAIFLVAALAVVLSEAVVRLPRAAVLIALCGVVIGCLGASRWYLAMERDDLTESPPYRTALFLKQVLPKEEIIVVVGSDWSCEVAFYAEKRAIYLPNWCPYDVVEKFVTDPSYLSGGKTIGAMVILAPGDYPPHWDQRSSDLVIAFAKTLSAGRPPLQLENHVTFVRKGLAWSALPEEQAP